MPNVNPDVEIDFIHHVIHEGLRYTVHDLATVSAATPKIYLIITPNTSTRVHIVFEVEGGAAGVKVELYEGTTTSDNGTAITPINNNRNSSNVTTLSVYKGPTVTLDGTQLTVEQSGSASVGGKVSGHAEFEEEFVLKQNTNYQLKITTLADLVSVSTQIGWYEVP